MLNTTPKARIKTTYRRDSVDVIIEKRIGRTFLRVFSGTFKTPEEAKKFAFQKAMN